MNKEENHFLPCSIEENLNITHFTTFQVETFTRYFTRFSKNEELAELFTARPEFKKNFICLGEGSNVLFVNPYSGLILKNEIKGIEITADDPRSVDLKVGAGENWHSFVLNCVERGWGGIENLSLIPGTVGAAPIQNIGAYGVEIKDSIKSVEYYDVARNQTIILSKEECKFFYRDSIFKRQGLGKWIITHVNIRLNKNSILNINYGSIKEELEKRKILNPTLKDVSNTIIEIRNSKLPDPRILGNAGSFFKNPIISTDQLNQLKDKFPDIVFYSDSKDKFKVAAAWLIEKCGLKGFKQGQCGVHRDQALVLVNYGGASGSEVLLLSKFIQEKVFQKFQINLEREVQVV